MIELMMMSSSLLLVVVDVMNLLLPPPVSKLLVTTSLSIEEVQRMKTRMFLQKYFIPLCQEFNFQLASFGKTSGEGRGHNVGKFHSQQNLLNGKIILWNSQPFLTRPPMINKFRRWFICWKRMGIINSLNTIMGFKELIFNQAQK